MGDKTNGLKPFLGSIKRTYSFAPTWLKIAAERSDGQGFTARKRGAKRP